MKMYEVNGFDAGMYVVFALVFGMWVGTTIEPAETEKDCEEMYEWNWAFNQCLKYQPACQMDKGHEKFVQYHQNRHALKERCTVNPGNFLSE